MTEEEIKALQAQNAQLEAENKDMRQKQRHQEIVALFAAIHQEPDESTMAELMKLDNDAFTFSANMMRKMAKQVASGLTQEVATKGPIETVAIKFSAPQGFVVDTGRLELVRKAKEYAATHRVDFAAAVAALGG